jgi:hypothetical protein
MEKTEGQKARDTVPLSPYCNVRKRQDLYLDPSFLGNRSEKTGPVSVVKSRVSGRLLAILYILKSRMCKKFKKLKLK